MLLGQGINDAQPPPAPSAEAINYSNDTISKVETAAQAPSPEMAERLDAHFDTDDTFQSPRLCGVVPSGPTGAACTAAHRHCPDQTWRNTTTMTGSVRGLGGDTGRRFAGCC